MTDGLNTNVGLLTEQGRGVVGGVPYGEQLLKEREDVRQMHYFAPVTQERFRAATRQALGR